MTAAAAFLSLFSTIFFIFNLFHSANSTTCHPNDHKALTGLLSALEFHSNQTSNSNSNCCQWSIVTCESSSSLGLSGTSSRVTMLEIQGSQLTGTLNFSSGSLTELRTLNLSVNFLHGFIPHSLFITLPKLEVLDLSTNYFTGEIPHQVFYSNRISKLRVLDISGNSLTGSLPYGLSNLSSLVTLDVSQNKFSGHLPDHVFQSLSELKFLILHSNSFNGPIPFSVRNSSTITLLNLRNNSFSGLIDLNCSVTSSLTSLDLGSNRFSGFVSNALNNCRNLKTINLSRNNISNGVPEGFKKLHNLSYLSMSNSSLKNITRTLDILQHCRNLTTLVLTLNFFDEEIPSGYNFEFRRLKVLVIANCRLSGSAPLWLSKSANLQLVDLSVNRLHGKIPEWFGDFDSLFYLDLSENSFTGEIPKTLTRVKGFIDGNIFAEEVASSFPFYFANDGLNRLQYNQVRNFPPTLRLQDNILTGTISPEFGNLKKLHVFNLKNNSLSGSIPDELSGMSSLESLDLSYNNLYGTIPESFTGLNFLSRFNVAHNHLHGRVPTGGQFATFPISSFDGNRDLCSDLINSPCDEEVPSELPDEENGKSYEDGSFEIFLAVGFATGFVIVVVLRMLLHF